ncbi:MAG: hypothetical protein WCP20_11100 [Desulfuromonadales bacterium]
MIDLNSAEIQSEGTGSAIPEDSIVAFKMTIRPPKTGKEGAQHPLFCRSAKGNEYIDVEFEAQGTFAGRKIWNNYTLAGSDAAAKISMRVLRAIVESARGIAPSDASPQATAGRQLADFSDFNGMVFLAKVKCVVEQSQKDGQWYVNNDIKRIITPDDDEYNKGEFISDKPLPPVPVAGASAAPKASAAAAPAWGTPPAAAATVAATSAMTHNPATAIPAWATR